MVLAQRRLQIPSLRRGKCISEATPRDYGVLGGAHVRRDER